MRVSASLASFIYKGLFVHGKGIGIEHSHAATNLPLISTD